MGTSRHIRGRYLNGYRWFGTEAPQAQQRKKACLGPSGLAKDSFKRCAKKPQAATLAIAVSDTKNRFGIITCIHPIYVI
jgi:hypothetical protein